MRTARTVIFPVLWATLLPLLSADGSEPSSTYNIDGQVRTRNCVQMLAPTATLRFPDGTPTGFFAYGDDPSKNGSAADCAIGYTEIDAQEILTSGSGMPMYFRPGGGPDQYVDPINKGQYGHIWSAELSSPPAPQPQNLNGKPCASMASGTDPFVINLIGVADDGAIYAGNLSSSSSSPQFILYRWANETSPQTVVFSGDPGNGDTNSLNQRWGDTLAVRGGGTNTQVLIASRGTLAAVLTPTDASLTSFAARTLHSDLMVGSLGYGLAFGSSNEFWAASGPAGNGTLNHLSFDPVAGTATTLGTFGSLPPTISPIALSSNRSLIAAIDMAPGPDLVRLYDTSNPSNSPVLLDRKPWVTSTSNNNFSGAVAFDGMNHLYALDSDNGLMAFTIASASTNPLSPLIYIAPTNTTAPMGSNALFIAGADGTSPLSYQWRFNNQNISGATAASLILSNVQPANGGAYTVVVTNLYGSTTSSPASLTISGIINPSPTIAYEPFPYSPGAALAGQGGWLLNSGTSGTIQSGNLAVPGLAAPASNHFAWTSSSMSIRLPVGINTNGALYFSFALRVSMLAAAASDTLAAFTIGTTTTYAPKINIVTNSAGTYCLGLYKGGGTSVGAVATNLLTTNDIVLVVARYIFNPGSGTDDTCDLWLNPAPATFGAANPPSPTVSDVGLGAGRTDMSQIDRFSFRSAAPALQCEADELRIGLTWASVTPPATPTLRINLTGDHGALLWPTGAPGFLLEQSSTISPSVWSPLSNTISLAGTNNSVSIGATNGPKFYRLRR